MTASDRIDRFLADYPDGGLLIAVGYATPAGIAWLAERSTNRQVSLLIGDTRYQYWKNISDSDRETCQAFMERPDVEIRNWYRTNKAGAGESAAHLKAWAATGDDDGTATGVLVGSGNLTRRGLTDNVEIMVEAHGDDKTATYREMTNLWGKAWDAKNRLQDYLNNKTAPSKSRNRRPKTNQPRKRGPIGPRFGGGPGPGPGTGQFNVGMDDIGDLLGGLFNRGGRGRGQPGATQGQRGSDLEVDLMLDFDDAVNGLETVISLTSGSGAEVRPRDVKVRIPAGVKTGQKLRLKQRGGPGRAGGPPGDLFVHVNVKQHELFGRSGKDLTLEVPITFSEAALGAKVKVPTLNGEVVKIRIPPGTVSGKTFRLKGRGGAGDLLVTVNVAVPQEPSGGFAG